MTGTKPFPEFIQEFRDQLDYLFRITQELSGLLGSYRSAAPTDYIEGYGESGSWFEAVK